MGVDQLQEEFKSVGSVMKKLHGEDMEQTMATTSQDLSSLELTQARSNPEKGREAETRYTAWMVEHPSALSKFDQMMSSAKDKKIIVFLDYDGTLSPIVDDPDQAFMSDRMRSVLNKVAQCFPTCIISGRRRDKVYEFVRLKNIYYVGSHGMDIIAPTKSLSDSNGMFQPRAVGEKGNEVVIFQPAKEFLPIIEQICTELEEKIIDIPGIMVENNKFCVSVHYRRVDEEDWKIVEEQVMAITKEYPSLHVTKGRKVFEIRPSIEWDKGRALEYLLEILGLGSDDEALPLYIGDDRTDEDAFKVLQRRGQGYPIVVSSIPKNTKASYSLRDPSEVMHFLLRLSRWNRSCSNGRLVV